MTDDDKTLVETVRLEAEINKNYDGIAYKLLTRIADRIETQAREIERLRGALQNIRALATKRQNVWGPDGCLTDIECFASAALAGVSHD